MQRKHINKLLSILLLMAVASTFLTPPSIVSAATPIAGYDACKSIVITHTDDAAQTNYQMKLTINKTSGSSSGNTLYLDNKATNWPYDIRFTNTTGGNLDFWRESNTSTEGVWWIEIDSIAAHPTDTTIYVQVGDADATDASNGSNTFLFFDHFLGASLDTNVWQGNTGNCVVSSSICTVTAATNAYYKLATKDGWANDVRMRASGVVNNWNYCAIVFNQEDNLTNQNDCLKVQHNSAEANHSNWNTQKSGTVTYMSHKLIDFGNYHIYDFIRLLSGTDTSKIFCDNVQVGASTTTNVPTVSLSPLIGTGETTGQTVSLDWVAVMITTYNEPTWGAYGSWEYPAASIYLTTSNSSGGTVLVPGIGTYAYNVSEIVNINASAYAGYYFSSWTGNTTNIANVSATNTTINMTSVNQTATANFLLTSIVSITNSPNTWTINGITGKGTILTNTTYYSNPLGDTIPPSATVNLTECRFTVTNDSSNVPLDLYITFSNFSGGDAMINSNTGSNGVTEFGAYAWYEGMTYSNKVIAKISGSSIFYNEWTGPTLNWSVEIRTRTNDWTTGSASTATITITAVED